MSTETLAPELLNGSKLHGDDFSPAQIAQWFEQERRGYYDIADKDDYAYGYHALNWYHGYRMLKGQFGRCLAIGCAKGEEILPIADRIDEIVAIEPAEPWWSDRIGNTPARYIAPSETGDLPLRDGSVDLVTCFGVLHHIPNVSHVMGEIARVMRPGALFLLREPSTSMGDWRKPRPGMTQNERGIARSWMIASAERSGLEVLKASHCDFGPIARVATTMGIKNHNSLPIVILDAIVSRLLGWNNRYWRSGFLQKLAPASVFYVLRKPH